MWRRKGRDLKAIEDFIRHLREFMKLKAERWEKVDERVQMENAPGSPSEDWIIPPDENATLLELKKDPDYLKLRSELSKGAPHMKKIASFIHFDTHHDFDWINFMTPLVGNDALDDALEMSGRLLERSRSTSYFGQNLRHLVRLWD